MSNLTQVLYFQSLEMRFHPLTGGLPLVREVASFITIPKEVKGYSQSICSEEGCSHLTILHRNGEPVELRSCKVFGCSCSDYKREEKEKGEA